MTIILPVREFHLWVTKDDQRRKVHVERLFARGSLGAQSGWIIEKISEAGNLFNLSDPLIRNRLIDSQHHFYQILAWVVLAFQKANLFIGLKAFCPVWFRMTPKGYEQCLQTALAQLALSG